MHAFSAISQRIVSRIKLDKSLNEISGLERLNDSILIAINDGGNLAEIIFLNTKGEILKRTKIINAKNNDWEDLATDDLGNLYISDSGNNSNNRQDLCILKVNAQAAYKSDSISTEKIFFKYSNQKAFPPPLNEQVFDCEALLCRKDSLHLITKIKANIHGKENRFPKDYVLPALAGSYIAKESHDSLNYLVRVGNKGIQDLVTSIDCRYEKVVVLTYSAITVHSLAENSNEAIFVEKHQKLRFKKLTQKEAVLLFSEKTIFVASEKHKFLGGPYLYKIKLP